MCIRDRIAGGVVHYDFTQGVNQSLGSSQQKWDPVYGMAMLHSGDYNQDGVIQTTDFDVWSANPAISNSYYISDGTLDGFVQTTDFDIWTYNRSRLEFLRLAFRKRPASACQKSDRLRLSDRPFRTVRKEPLFSDSSEGTTEMSDH